MKKYLLLLLVIVFIIAGCGSKNKKEFDEYSSDVISILHPYMTEYTKNYNTVKKSELEKRLKDNQGVVDRLSKLKVPENNIKIKNLNNKANELLKNIEEDILLRLEVSKGNQKLDVVITDFVKASDKIQQLYGDVITLCGE